MAGKILEGVFAIEKPPSLSSAQVLRDLQSHFMPSQLFAPLLQQTRAQQAEQDRHQSKRRRQNDAHHQLKMGHGGTLDPLATGVLIVAVGKAGTKRLSDFLDCTKTYETVVLFGKSTDTYDIAGKVVSDASYAHVTRELVEEQLAQFRGKIKQVPPIYSALKINGMKAYEYARSGKELPRELESRDMVVTECKLLDWYDGGAHDYRWPAAQAAQEEKDVAKKLMEHASTSTSSSTDTSSQSNNPTAETANPAPIEAVAALPPAAPSLETLNALPPSTKALLHTHAIPESSLETKPAASPAVRISLSVSSGFYVRSFAHDLGIACRSLGIMAELARTRQAEFTTVAEGVEGLTPALRYEELGAGEGVWGPTVEKMLERWIERHPVVQEGRESGARGGGEGFRDRGGYRSQSQRGGRRGGDWKGFGERKGGGGGGGGGRGNRDESRWSGPSSPAAKRRRKNSSSPE